MLSNHSNSSGIRVNYLDKDALDILSDYLSLFMEEETLIVCIGTDKCIGDCLGPLVGTLLLKSGFDHPIIGTLQMPAHAINLDTIIKDVKRMYPNHFTIAIDACLGYDNCVGDIQIKMGPVHPGKGVGKKLPQIGDISIVGVVDTIDNSDLFSIKNIRLNFIMNMAELISQALIMASKKVRR